MFLYKAAVEQNDIPDLLQRWKQRHTQQDPDRTGKAFFVRKQEITSNAYDLRLILKALFCYQSVGLSSVVLVGLI